MKVKSLALNQLIKETPNVNILNSRELQNGSRHECDFGMSVSKAIAKFQSIIHLPHVFKFAHEMFKNNQVAFQFMFSLRQNRKRQFLLE